MSKITSVPAVSMDLQPDSHSAYQSGAILNERNDARASFQKCFESYLQEAAASSTVNAAQSQAADVINSQYLLMMLPRGPKVRLAAHGY